MNARLRRVLVWCGVATLLSALDGSVLFLALPAISAEFHAEVPSLANIGSVVTLGALGALPLGVMADRRGRRVMIAGGTIAFGLADVTSALAPSLTWLAAARVAATIFETAVAETALIAVVEEMPAEHRGLGAAAMTLSAAVGGGIALIVYPLLAPHWRSLYLVGAIAVPAGPAIWLRLPESAVWQRAAELPALVWRGRWVRRLVIVVAAALLADVLYTPAGLFLALYGNRELHLQPATISVVVVTTGIIGAGAYPVGGWLTDKIGRRGLGVALALGNAVGGGATFVGGLPAYWGGNLVSSALLSAAAPVFGAWTAELFPTRARVTVETIDVVAGALGGVAGLQLAGQLAGSLGLGRSIALEAVAALIGAGLLLLLPETRGQRLEA